ncbi:hypothetical protein NL50_09790 [Clostridium acetobutylicum]|nr:hypothetical protein NL50_09790 [Clostridium acetobutylicum]
MKKKVHKNRLALFLSAIIILTSFVGCSESSTSKKSNSNTAKTIAKPKPKTAQSVLDELKKKESAYMTNITVVTADNDSNKLLGRPNQYTEKVTWEDNRSKDSQVDCSIELFKNKDDAKARKDYLEKIIKSMPMLTQYIEQKDNVLLRIDGVLTPAQSKEYINIFDSIFKN